MRSNTPVSDDIFSGPKTVHVYSKLTNDQLYPVYDNKIEEGPEGKRQVNIIVAHVFIEGGAHRMDKRLETSVGKLTSISEKALDFLLKSCDVFKAHVKHGMVTYRRDMVDIERAAADFTSERDPSAQLTPEDWMGADPNETPIPTTKAAEQKRGGARRVKTDRPADWKA
jgi:hypothetical protein